MKHSFRNMIFSSGRDDAGKRKTEQTAAPWTLQNVYETVPRIRVTIFVDEA
jgi:hypothetical protein